LIHNAFGVPTEEGSGLRAVVAPGKPIVLLIVVFCQYYY
jgi:hypothetical protein